MAYAAAALIVSRTSGRNRLGIEVNPVVRTAKQWDDPADPLVAQIKASEFAVVLDTRESEDA